MRTVHMAFWIGKQSRDREEACFKKKEPIFAFASNRSLTVAAQMRDGVGVMRFFCFTEGGGRK